MKAKTKTKKLNLQLRQPKLTVRSLEPAEVEQAQLAMRHLAAGAAQLIGENIRAVSNIYGKDKLAMPSTKPLMAMAGMTVLFIKLAELGSESIKVIEEITTEINKLGDPNLDRFVASEMLEKILRLIGGKMPKLLRQLSYGLAASKSAKDGFHQFVAGKKAMGNAASITKFSVVLPEDFRKACLNTAKSSARIRPLAKDQHERASKIQTDFNSAFSEDLLPGYAETVAVNADAIPVLTAKQAALKAEIGASANKARPDLHLAESQMLEATNSLVEAMQAMARAREKYFLRAGALNTSATGTIGARAIAENTGGLAMKHVDQLGFMLVIHFFRMLTMSLLALSVALGFAETAVIVKYWEVAAEEDEMTAKAMTMGVAGLQPALATKAPAKQLAKPQMHSRDTRRNH